MHGTILGLPDGYNTLVREQGKNFSGGQRQRLAIARAILRDAPILILDEPTASLDVEAEAEVMRALDTLIIGRTVIVISHRLSTLGNVDEIIVLGNGHILEKGSYKDLKRLNGVFAGLLDEQNRYSAESIGEKSILRSAFMPALKGDDPLQGRVGSGGYANQRPVEPPVRPIPQPVSNPGIAAVGANGNQAGANGNQQTPLRARVMIEVDDQLVGTKELNKSVMTIGRLSGNDIQVPSQRVSRQHAKIYWEQGKWMIEDAHSLNGIVYQGNRVDQHPLVNGDRVLLAPKVVLRYESVG